MKNKRKPELNIENVHRLDDSNQVSQNTLTAKHPTTMSKALWLVQTKPFWDGVNQTLREMTGYGTPNNYAVLYLHGPHTSYVQRR